MPPLMVEKKTAQPKYILLEIVSLSFETFFMSPKISKIFQIIDLSGFVYKIMYI